MDKSFGQRRVDAQRLLEGTEFTAVPTEQLADMYGRFKRLTRMGQATIEEWSAMPKAEADLRHAVFSESDFGACFAGQWLDDVTRHKVWSETRPCACHPSERPAVCQHRYALSECLAAATRKPC